MPPRTGPYEELTTAFSHGNFKPLLLLYGQERYFIDRLQESLIAGALQPHEKDFNLDIVYGPDADIASVLALCAGYPVMAQRRVIIVRDFDRLQDNDRFKTYAAQPNPTAIVLLVAGEKVNLSRHPYRAIKAAGGAYEFKPIFERELPGWLERYAKTKGRTLSGDATRMLAEYVGTNLQQATAELDKLITFAGDRTELTADDVVRASGHTREFNVFELQRLAVEGHYAQAMRIADRLLQQASNGRGEALMIVSVLTKYFTKLWILTACQRRRIPEKEMASLIGVPPYYLKEYLSNLARFDSSALAAAFSALVAADFELKGGTARDEYLVLTLMLRRLSGAKSVLTAA